MKREDVELLAELRKHVVLDFEKLRDYKQNPQALMKEVDHAKKMHDIIVAIDRILARHVKFG